MPLPTLPGLPSFPAGGGACGILGLLQSGTAFASAATGAVANIQAQIAGLTDTLTVLPNLVTGIAQAAVENIKATLMSTVSAAMTSLTAHITAQLTNLVSNLAMSVSHLAAQAGLAGSGGKGCNFSSSAAPPPGAGPCTSMTSLFGSVLGGANQFLDPITMTLTRMTASLQGLVGAADAVVADVLAGVNAALGTLTGLASQVTAMIANEVAGLAAMLGDLLNFAHISSLFGMASNPCAKQVLSAVGTPALASSLGVPSTPAPRTNMSPAQIVIEESLAKQRAQWAAQHASTPFG